MYNKSFIHKELTDMELTFVIRLLKVRYVTFSLMKSSVYNLSVLSGTRVPQT